MSESQMNQVDKVEKVLPQHWANKLDNAPDAEAGRKAIDEFLLYGASIGAMDKQLEFVRAVSGFETKAKGVDMYIQKDQDGEEVIVFGLP
ncbi:MAG: hypothetical protein Q8T09_16065 [Candidatus Melainabacteria bacterium]|nr:hypothetical protein [Candidatus Melainabacteria bacterium]